MIFGIAYAIPKMISAPSTILVLLALAYALALAYWAFNFLPWRDDAMRLKATQSALKPTKTN